MKQLAFEQGIYRARVTRWQLGKSKNGHPQLVMSFIPLGMIDANDPEAGLQKCANFERSIFRVIMDSTIDYVVQDLRRLGYDRDDFTGLNPDLPGSFDFRDMEIDVRCSHREYQNEMKEDWQFQFGGMIVKPLENDEVKKLNALFGKKLKAASAAPPTSRPIPANTAAAAAAAQTDYAAPGEDIPF